MPRPLQEQADPKRVQTGVHFLLGNYALVEGAMSAGCDFFAGYPITPANEISERMSQRLPQVGGQFLQGEDELASIYACAGAALSGAKAMTATASAGFNYMQEGLGYCYTVEAPVVVANVMRTRGDNFATHADIMQLRYGASGDYEAIVVCPSSVQELYDYTIWAFNLAETYRNPVIIASETTIALMRERLHIPQPGAIWLQNRRYTEKNPADYLPFAANANAAPDMAPLAKGYHTIYSLNPHDEAGRIDWDPDAFERLYKRITGKIRENEPQISRVNRWMMDDADMAIVTYGSEVRPAREAAVLLREEGIKMGVVQLCNVWPVPEGAIREVTEQVGQIFALEMNLGKYVGEIQRVVAGKIPVTGLTKNRGLVHTPWEVVQGVKEGVRK